MLNLFNKRKSVSKKTTAYSHNFSRPLMQKKFSLQIFISLSVFVLLGTYFLLNSYILKITRFTINTDPDCISQEVVKKGIESSNRKYFFANFSQVRDDILSKYPCVKDILFKKNFPDSLTITVLPRVAVATVKTIYLSSLKPRVEISKEASPSTFEPQLVLPTPSSTPQVTTSSYFLSDEGGYLFREVESDQFQPEIDILDTSLKLRSKIQNDLIKKTLDSLKKLQELGLTPQKSEIVGQKLYIFTDNNQANTLVILSLDQNMEKQFAYLKLIVSQAVQEEKSLVRVDLRFEKPAVIFAK